MNADPTNPLPNDPIATTENAASVGTDVSIGPSERFPAIEGDCRPGQLGEAPPRAPGSTPANHSDVATPHQEADMQGTDPSVPPTDAGPGVGKSA